MNWTIAIADLIVVVGAAIVFIWRLSDANRRLLNMEERHKEHDSHDEKRFAALEFQLQRLRDWRHEKVGPILQEIVMRLGPRQNLRQAEKPLEWTQEDDSRVTNKPEKEPLR